MALAMVISRPSSTHAVPSARIIRVWNGDQFNRSIRAGIKLRMVPESAAGAGDPRLCVIGRTSIMT
ncbi:hypothetical protein Apa02nite_051120 [Actinoplanes palleronii]|uniref:Uncharacterized protein n=1 Tax=Actinoplanes palleronii TaxID=113570 RepID=A0ABQ4BE93_9ACTN|nr:hypothetical protein Apa02nite_051120 [Actinoplanes palleronii]